jgi:hypothetical protein
MEVKKTKPNQIHLCLLRQYTRERERERERERDFSPLLILSDRHTLIIKACVGGRLTSLPAHEPKKNHSLEYSTPLSLSLSLEA